MLTAVRTSQFSRDVKRLKKQGKDMAKLKTLVEMILDQKLLPKKYLDHQLKGKWKDYRDAHIEPDWLLLYKITRTEAHFVRTGSHSELFKN